MAITPVQPNIETQKKTYRDANKHINTSTLAHPIPAEGHLVHDSLLSVPKFWMKDIAYDVKAVKDGFTGKANDHQLGRLNDVGLKLTGIGIATYLASRTTDPKMRIMEYLGLGTFLASMSIYPALTINGASRLVQGFDIGKQYIDDQGRKKSVFQDGNYIPFDMYRGEYTGEDLDIIADRMGIPRGIKNRDELTKEQMRKIAVQNNTLWMLGAGFATPVMTALTCCGLEHIVSPAMEIVRNKNYNSQISKVLKATTDMTLNVAEIDSNSLSKKTEKILSKFKGQELPKEELNSLVEMLSDEVDSNLKIGIKEDIEKIFKSAKNSFVVDENIYEDIKNAIKNASNGRKNVTFEQVFATTENDIKQALRSAGSDGKYITPEQLQAFKGELKKIYSAKIEAANGNKIWLKSQQNNVIENISKVIQKKPSSLVTEENIKNVIDFAKVLGDFKEKDRVIDKCKSFKVEYAPETVLARSYKKFENELFKDLNIGYKDLKQMKESEELTKEILEKKIQALVSNEEKYSKTVEKLAKIMSETEVRLHGESMSGSDLKDLINAIENNYNKTAKRINNIGEGKFTSTIDKLIKDDVNGELKNIVNSREDLFKLVDGTVNSEFFPKDTGDSGQVYKFAEEESRGVGSSKRLKISRIVDRIQGVENSQRRMLHVLDFYKHSTEKLDEYGKHLNSTVKDVLLGATSADHMQKLYTENNPLYYKDIMNTGWDAPLEDSTKGAMEKAGDISKGDVFKRFERYIRRFKDVMGNNDIDFYKPNHKFISDLKNLRKEYNADSTTRLQNFNLVAQNPIDFFKKASKTRFENQKWLRTASAIGASVLGATLAAQFFFGKIRNPHNIVKKQVSDGNNI